MPMIPSDPFRPLWPARVEYRQIELYSKKRKSPPVAEARPDTVDGQAELRALSLAFQRLDDHFFAADPLLGEGRSSWQRYLELPRRHTVDRIAAELYRILRICRIAALHQSAHREWRDGLLRLSCTFNRCALSLNLTPQRSATAGRGGGRVSGHGQAALQPGLPRGAIAAVFF
jgi:hypothetical protein